MAIADLPSAADVESLPRSKPDAADIPLPLRRSRIGKLMGVQILATGSSVPKRRIRNEDLAALGYDAEWIVQRTGILERRHAEPHVATSDLAAEAGRRCIAAAGVDPCDVDLVLVGTYTPDVLLPATANIVQEKLGLCAPALDLQAACASFAFALITGMQYIGTGCCRLALVIGADCNSRIVNPADQHTYPLFGDGAGAVLLAPGAADQGILAYAAGSDGSGFDLLCRPMGGTREPFSHSGERNGRHYLKMYGRPVFKWAVRMLRETVFDVLRSADMTLEEVDLVVFHQANMRIISAAVEELRLDPCKVFNNLERYGNTSSASIPLALDEAIQEGRIRRGQHVLFSGFGAGLAWGTVLMRW